MKGISPIHHDFRAFLVMADRLSLSRAADQLGIQQSGLSKVLKRLEAQFGKPLFVRVPQGLALTRHGETLQTRLRRLTKEWETLSGSADLMGSDETIAKLSLAAHVSLATAHFPGMVRRLYRLHPEIDLSLEFGSSRDIARQVSRGAVDLGVVVEPEPFQSLVIRKLLLEEVFLYAGKTGSGPVIAYQPEMVGLGKVLKSLKQTRTLPVQSYEVIASMACDGAVTALLPQGVASRYPGLKRVSPSLGEFKVCLVYNGLYASPAVRRLAEEFIRRETH